MGLIWNAAEQVVEGFTSFLWVAIGTMIELLTSIPPHKSMVFIGITSWLTMGAIVVPHISKLIAPDQFLNFRMPRSVCILAILLTPQVALGAFQGLETALYTCILALIVLFAIKADTPWMKGLLIICSVIAFMTRPDAFSFLLPLWGVLIIFSNKPERKAYLHALGMLVLVLMLFSAVKWQWSGYPFPNTFYVKRGLGLGGFKYVSRYLSVFTPVWLFIAYSFGRVGFLKLLRDRSFMLLIVPSLIFCFSYSVMNPTMGWAFRFLIPTWPLIVLAALRVEALHQKADSSNPATAGFLNARTIFFLTLILLTLISWRFMRSEYNNISDLCKLTSRANVAGGMILSSATSFSPAPVIATGDIGALSYFSKLKSIDLIGLTDTKIAHLGLTHEYLMEKRPDIIVLQDLFLQPCPPDSHSLNVALTIDGAKVWLDIERYRSILADPSRAHNGAGSTYQVVTSPRFTDLYIYMGRLSYSKGYPLFLRKDYKCFKELVALLSKIVVKAT